MVSKYGPSTSHGTPYLIGCKLIIKMVPTKLDAALHARHNLRHVALTMNQILHFRSGATLCCARARNVDPHNATVDAV